MQNIIIALGVLIAAASAQELCLEHDRMPNCAELSSSALSLARDAKTSGEIVYSVSAGRDKLLQRYAKSCDTLVKLVMRIDKTTEPSDCHINAYANFLDKCSASGWSYGECARFWDSASKRIDADALEL